MQGPGIEPCRECDGQGVVEGRVLYVSRWDGYVDRAIETCPTCEGSGTQWARDDHSEDA